MKTMIIALTALVSISSAFADSSARLTERNGVQNLTISGRTRSGIPLPGVLSELPSLLMRATGVLKIKRYPDASFFEGQYLSGSNSCPAGFCTRELTIEQKKGFAGPGRMPQQIARVGAGIYEVRGEAAHELYDAVVAAGVRPERSRSKMPGTLVSGDSFICSAVPLNGMAFKCTISVNENLN